jgi:hypothetical protein
MAVGFLQVQGDKIVNGNGKPIILRGAAIGGWMKSVSSIHIRNSRNELTGR